MRANVVRAVLGVLLVVASFVIATYGLGKSNAVLGGLGTGLLLGAGLWGVLTPSAEEIREEERRKPCPYCGNRKDKSGEKGEKP